MRVVMEYSFPPIDAGAKGKIVKHLPKKKGEKTVSRVLFDDGQTVDVPAVCLINEIVWDRLALAPKI